MKLVRFGPSGEEKPGLLDREGVLRDLSHIIGDWTAEYLAPTALARIAGLAHQELPAVTGSPRLGVPVGRVGKFIAVGMNYSDHVAEANRPFPAEPLLFTKAISCLSGPSDDVMLPRDSTKSDWEVELGVVIGTTARYVELAQALDHVAGYCLVNDLSEREYQNDRGGTLDKGKGCDTFGPVGPWLVTRNEIDDPQNLDLWLDVNGERRQTGNTRTMIFSVAYLVAYISCFMTLEPGDILATGTPPGIGVGVKPNPIFLKAGDVMRLGSPRLGVQEQTVRPWRRT
jgi:2-keto-4-pentenoate hydratase/2-oxohepta-3-ene-1,7-dioic acid hydratase in catechol pathway